MAIGADIRTARMLWNRAVNERAGVREALRGMSAAVERCMYCADSRGTDIDHFEPVCSAPIRTFDWLNHLLACSSCNSNAKRDRFPRDSDGEPMLIDPTRDDPYDHLRLSLRTGDYDHLTAKGQATIEVFQLNRADLKRGRELAFPRCQAMLREYLRLREGEKHADAETMLNALHQQPFADVLYAMYKAVSRPGALLVLGGQEVMDALAMAFDVS